MTTLVPVPGHVTIEPAADFPGYVSISFHWRAFGGTLDRPSTHGMVVRPPVAERLKAAFLAGDLYHSTSVTRDVDGHTYVRATCRVMGKYANADLRRIGY